MDIDIAVLRSLEREKEIGFDVVVDAIEQALLVAYHRTEGAQPLARVELNRKTSWARNGKTPQPASVASPPPRPVRSSCSDCETPKTS
jgi:hypothetical protein